MMLALCDRRMPASSSARSRSTSVRPPTASEPACKNDLRVRPSQYFCEPWKLDISTCSRNSMRVCEQSDFQSYRRNGLGDRGIASLNLQLELQIENQPLQIGNRRWPRLRSVNLQFAFFNA